MVDYGLFCNNGDVTVVVYDNVLISYGHYCDDGCCRVAIEISVV